MNNAGELTRVGNVPSYYDTFFVDDNNRMYYKKGYRDDHLVVCDAFSGEIISDSEVCLRFVLSGDNQVAAYCIEESYEEPRYSKWIVISKDGTRSQVITRDRPLYTASTTPRYTIEFAFGYRNGVLAVCNGTDGDHGYAVSTYTKDGLHLKDLYTGTVMNLANPIVCPINPSLVFIAEGFGSLFWGYPYCRVFYYTEYDITAYAPTEGYLSYQGDDFKWIGTDQVYCYLAVRICVNIAEEGEDPQYEWLDEWDILRVAIDNYSVEKIKTINGVLSYPGTVKASPFGHIVQEITNGDNIKRTIIDISTMSDVYTGVLTDVPNTIIQENVGWIWIPDKGVYQKTPLDWLMSASGEYPRSSPWGKCGYAIGNYKIGQNGLAIVLFE